MQIVPIKSIQVRERQRRTISPQPLAELKQSILKKAGLLHPPICVKEGEAFVLLTGERRFRAIQQLAESGATFTCHNAVVEPGNIPIALINDLTEDERFEAELDENIHREELSWQDRCRAFAALYEMRKAEDPKATFSGVAKEIVGNGSASVSGRAPAKSADHIRETVKEAVALAPFLDKTPIIAKARSHKEAYSQLLRLTEEKARMELAKRRLAAAGSGSAETLSHSIRHGDMREILPQLDSEQFDLILADPPYGINADSANFRKLSAQGHNYDDTSDEARDLLKCILTEGFRLTKPRANLFIFISIENWNFIQLLAKTCGWVPFPRPAIWGKSATEGLAPWGSQGFRLTTEFIFFATKGRRGLVTSPTDYMPFSRVSRTERVHGAEKPVDLLTRLIEVSTQPGDYILDPCCGSGSTIVAAKGVQRRAMGIEKDQDYYTSAMARVFGMPKAEEPKEE
jgi:site-specific DNA-methyltransferase (adenine-specific)